MELGKYSAQVEDPGCCTYMGSEPSQQSKQQAGWREEEHKPQSSQLTRKGLTLDLKELSVSQFFHLEGLSEAGVPLRIFQRKIRNFINRVDTEAQRT